MASHTTRDHDEIRCWAEDHDATPSVVSRSGGMLRFEFAANLPGELADVSWDDFFGVFDERGLELVYDDKPGSRFHKLVYPETVEARPATRRPARAKIQPIRARSASSRTGTQARSPKAKPRVTRTGMKTLARGKSTSRRRPKAA
ncbi:MAG: hypothetical protein EPN33_13485 [Acidobacteria bacterium]|nr:MAG: hypothetical protein EPN33_13485 [Acidobacteriota bacterium]